MKRLPAIFAPSSITLLPEEFDFFSEVLPYGFILFRRNCETPRQVRELINALREATDDASTPIFIDEEGGRVTRLNNSFGKPLPPALHIGEAYARVASEGMEAARTHARRIAARLRIAGLTATCAPVLDLLLPDTAEAIGDRALSSNPHVISMLGRIIMDTLLSEGIKTVIKHLPGHGRAKVDPHAVLPVVDATTDELKQDFIPFRALADSPYGMNCHVVFSSIDPHLPASLSPIINREIIREQCGFRGVLITDDLAMGALDAFYDGDRGVMAGKAIESGADLVLYCKGDLPTMVRIADALPI